MARNMSFAMTEAAILARTKTVTRRLGWKFLKVGDRIQAVHRTMGFKRGEHPRHLAILRVKNIRSEPLDTISSADVAAEGYPGMRPAEFVEKFCMAMNWEPHREVTRIEFEYMEERE
jgi:hypothetical protein